MGGYDCYEVCEDIYGGGCVGEGSWDPDDPGGGDEYCWEDYLGQDCYEVCDDWPDDPIDPEPDYCDDPGNWDECYGDGGGDYYPDPEEVDPCDHAAQLGSNENFKSILRTLKTTADNADFKHEVGYVYSHNGDQMEKTLITGEEGAAGIEFSLNGQIDGFAHTHYVGLLSVFSPDDIYSMAQLYMNGNMNDAATFSMVVVTQSGTQYMLMIEDETKFSTYADNLVGNSTLHMFSDLFNNLYKINA
ncbi:hypothetical protein, partial [Sinomicrobium soli]|uniref:hypothetical protein n=1 Tax=Sinomicrobium sp. N-1-3-6 TaxID=2219864 RepID=UPI000DCBA2B4